MVCLKVTFIFAIAIIAFALNPCRKFECRDPVDPQNLEVCAELIKNSPTDWVEYVGSCPVGKTCKMSETSERTLKCVENPEFHKFPGLRCNDPSLCAGPVVDGICRGKSAGEKCVDHIECDVGLRCGLDLMCEQAAMESEHCDNDHLLCQSYLYCHENTCIKYGSITNGHNPGRSGEDLCASHYVNDHGVCDEGPTLKGEVFVDSNEALCVYSNGEQNRAVCGFHQDGKAICKPGDGTLLPEWNELLDYLNRKPSCHSQYSHLGQCDYAEKVMDSRLYLKGRLAYAHLHYFTQIQANPPCIQKFNHPEYFELLNRYNGAATISALFAALIAVLFILL